ncbi:hypothetical protein HZH66_004611 [Vespula vulgaris]|uniref:Uncharacterized protein n=1 Tax=Vespula vulgaris TaxID=7454 RepID=A0A834KCJ3_VESVU|nr:hypothetical protein HZH66_004611 [Vespula vulgaris]
MRFPERLTKLEYPFWGCSNGDDKVYEKVPKEKLNVLETRISERIKRDPSLAGPARTKSWSVLSTRFRTSNYGSTKGPTHCGESFKIVGYPAITSGIL